MIRLTEIRLPLDHGPDALAASVAARLRVPVEKIKEIKTFRRAYDARKRQSVSFVFTLDVTLAAEEEAAALLAHAGDGRISRSPQTGYVLKHRLAAPPRRRPLVIGAGPCGLMAALTLAEMGHCPLILERGRVVRERTVDTFALWRKSVLTPESNVQFGEGGAGTFSDGKLYSGVGDPEYLGRRVLEVFVQAGAPEEILYVSKPHIGTFRLVSMVESLRARIEALGGEYRFGARVERLLIDAGSDGQRRLRGVRMADGSEIEADYALLAPGHSARDLFVTLHDDGVAMEPKPFSIGVRIEHPQGMIDRARLGVHAGNKLLGAADYKLVHHASNGRSVYSFCMCPGGTVVAAASEPGGVVTNGMSQYSRAERNANAGIVVGITPADYPGSVLAGIDLQRRLEQAAFIAGGSDYRAPAQLAGDFLAARPTAALGDVQPSYRPGVTMTDLAQILPGYAVAAMREALPAFAQKIPGFDRHDAVLTGVETRTSSPLRIKRGQDYQSTNIAGLYPAGEGCGFAGGIMSAAIDGIRVAEAMAIQAREPAGG